MAFFGKGKRGNLQVFCDDLCLTATEEFELVDLLNLITTHANYEQEYTKNLLTTAENLKTEHERLDLEN